MSGTRRQARSSRCSIPCPRPGPPQWGPDPPTLRVREGKPSVVTGAGATAPGQFLSPGAGGEHLPPGVTEADRPGARMWPRRSGAGGRRGHRGDRHRRGEGSRDTGVGPRPSPPRRAPHFNRPSSAGRFPALLSSVPVRPPHLLGSTPSASGAPGSGKL